MGRVVQPSVINPRPGMVCPILGGILGTLLLTAGIYLAPVAGVPLIDVPHLMGGIVTTDPAAAFWLGMSLHLVAGSLVFPAIFGLLWPLLPGPMSGIVANVVKGVGWGLVLWLVSGLLMGVAGLLERLGPDVVHRPGLFALGLGWEAAVALLAGHVVYGLALGLLSYMASDVFPLETLGWPGYLKAELPPGGNLYQNPRFPEHPPLGAR